MRPKRKVVRFLASSDLDREGALHDYEDYDSLVAEDLFIDDDATSCISARKDCLTVFI